MASISFETPEKMNDENKPLPRTPHTPHSHKVQDVGRTSSQKKARQIFDSLRSLKSRGKIISDVEDEGVQSSGTGSPIRRKNSTWDLFGNIRSKRSSEFGTPENERPLTNTPSKSEMEMNDTHELIPKRRKSLVHILGSMHNKVSPRRVANPRESPLDQGRLPDYLEGEIFAQKLAKELVCLSASEVNLDPPYTSTSNGPSSFPSERLRGCHSSEVDHNQLIENFKARQLDDLLNDRHGCDGNSWTSQAQTLQDEEMVNQATSQIPIINGDRSKTPDSYLCSIIESFDDYNPQSTILKEKGATVSPSPSPDKLKPMKPFDFLKDSSPDVIPKCQAGPSNQPSDTSSSILYYIENPKPLERSDWEEKQPIITIREVASDSDVSFAYEDSVAPLPSLWQDTTKSEHTILKSRARLPDHNSESYVPEFESSFVDQIEKIEELKDYFQGLGKAALVNQTEKRGDHCQSPTDSLLVNQSEQTEELNDHSRCLVEPAPVSYEDQTMETRDHHQGQSETPFLNQTEEPQDHSRGLVESPVINHADQTIETKVLYQDLSKPLLVSGTEQSEDLFQGLVESPCLEQTEKRQNQCQNSTAPPPIDQTEELKDNCQRFSEPPLLSPIEELYHHGQASKPIHSSTEESDSQRIARSIKQTVDKMTKNLHLSSFSEEITDDWDDETPNKENCPSKLEHKHSLNSGQIKDDLSETVEDLSTKVLEELPDATMIRSNIGSFKNLEFLTFPTYVKYPQSEAKWRHVQCFPTGSLALSDIRKQNRGEFSDTITYCLERSTIYVHLWGKVPKLQKDFSVCVRYPETKTRSARTQTYDNGDLAMADIDQQNIGEFSDIRYDAFERCFYVHTWGNVVQAPDYSFRVDFPETATRSATTRIYVNKDLAMADIYQRSHGEFSEIRYDASQRHFRVFTWDEVIDTPNGYIRVNFQEPELEKSVRVDYPETMARWAKTQTYESEDQATADIYRLNNKEYSKFIYDSPEQRFHVEAQTEATGSARKTREPSWKPTLSPLGDRDEEAEDLPDFSDLENNFQLVATESLRSFSPGIQSQEGLNELIDDDNSGSNNISLCVETGTPRKTENEFIAELFIANQSDNPVPLLRGSKQILQYLDNLDGKSSKSNIPETEDLESDRMTATKLWAESRLTDEAPQSAKDTADEPFAQTATVDYNDNYSNDETTSPENGFLEMRNRKCSELSDITRIKISRFTDAFGNEDSRKNYVNHEVSETAKEGEALNKDEDIISDFDRDLVFRRGRSNAICGENIHVSSFQGILNDRDQDLGPPVIGSSSKSDESIYILPIDNIDLYEENAGCGDVNLSSSDQIDMNITAFSQDADLTVLTPEFIDTLMNFPVTIDSDFPSRKVDIQPWGTTWTLPDAKREKKTNISTTGLWTNNVEFPSKGLWTNTCLKLPSTDNVSACTVSHGYDQLGLEISSISGSTKKSTTSDTETGSKDTPKEEVTKAEDGVFRVETASQEYIDNEVPPPAPTRTESSQIPTLVNIFHARGIISPSRSSTPTRPFLNRCSSPLPPTKNGSPKRGGTQAPRIITPSGKVYSPAKEEEDEKNKNPIQRVQTPGSMLGKSRGSSMCMGTDMCIDTSGYETDVSEGFGVELEKTGAMTYLARSHGEISLSEGFEEE